MLFFIPKRGHRIWLQVTGHAIVNRTSPIWGENTGEIMLRVERELGIKPPRPRGLAAKTAALRAAR